MLAYLVAVELAGIGELEEAMIVVVRRLPQVLQIGHTLEVRHGYVAAVLGKQLAKRVAVLDRLVAKRDAFVADALVHLQPPLERQQIAFVRHVQALGAHHGRALLVEVAEQQLGLGTQRLSRPLVCVLHAHVYAHLDVVEHIGDVESVEAGDRILPKQLDEAERRVYKGERVAAHGPRRVHVDFRHVDAMTLDDHTLLYSHVHE